jgi:hypothetical protein
VNEFRLIKTKNFEYKIIFSKLLSYVLEPIFCCHVFIIFVTVIKSGRPAEIIKTEIMSTVLHDFLCVNYISSSCYNNISFASLNVILTVQMLALRHHTFSHCRDVGHNSNRMVV